MKLAQQDCKRCGYRTYRIAQLVIKSPIEPQPLLAINDPTSLLIRIDTPLPSPRLPTPATSTCLVCYSHAYSTLGCPLLLRDALSNIAAVYKGKLRGKNTSDGHNTHLNRITVSIIINVWTTPATLLPLPDETQRSHSLHALPNFRRKTGNRENISRNLR